MKKSEVGSESWFSVKGVPGHEAGWASAETGNRWSFAGDDEEEENLFDVAGSEGEREGEGAELGLEGLVGSSVEEDLESKKSEEKKQLEIEEKALSAILKGKFYCH